ncbi:MAG: universal stress protein [Flavobacteriales bacterium]|nr:universal stress protein [Flavobacteriales bacterium]
MKDILCATDLSPASDTALYHALLIAGRAGKHVDLLHVLDKHASEESEARAREHMAHRIAEAGGSEVARVVIMRGDPLTAITEAASHAHGLVVLCTHGPRGLRQSLFGADILKLVRKLPIPALVVQEHSPRREMLDRIVMPVAAHEDVDKLEDITIELARLFAAEVEVYEVIRPLGAASEELARNKRETLRRLAEEGVRHREVNEESEVFSAGFAEPTIRHAEKAGASCIAMMAHASREYRFIADAEKERMFTNTPGIPVLCA